jgi:hypothetical protein
MRNSTRTSENAVHARFAWLVGREVIPGPRDRRNPRPKGALGGVDLAGPLSAPYPAYIRFSPRSSSSAETEVCHDGPFALVGLFGR